ncbi:hypothetical protein K2X89_10310 [Myxococcota bacterium]|nr:hypothetical protein [Myxococcota bacterium]
MGLFHAGLADADGLPFALADLDGRWIQRDARVDADRRRAAIEAAIQPLAWVVRKMAGGVLHSKTAPDPTLHFVWDGERLHQRLSGKRDVQTRLVEPGSPASTGLDGRGEPFEGQWLWTSDGLAFRWKQHQAYGTNLYRLDPIRHEITIDHAIHITALEDVLPIVYRSRFVQAELPAVSAASEPAVR